MLHLFPNIKQLQLELELYETNQMIEQSFKQFALNSSLQRTGVKGT